MQQYVKWGGGATITDFYTSPKIRVPPRGTLVAPAVLLVPPGGTVVPLGGIIVPPGRTIVPSGGSVVPPIAPLVPPGMPSSFKAPALLCST